MFNKEYFEFTDFNDIENLYIDLYNKIYPNFVQSPYFPSSTLYPSMYIYPAPYITAKVWAMIDIPFIEEIDRIEQNIKLLADVFTTPPGFTVKTWLIYPLVDNLKSFSLTDYNRWLINMRLLEEAISMFRVRFSGTSYCGEGVWL